MRPGFAADSSGNYKFSNLPLGNYRVRELLSNGYRRLTPASGFYDVPAFGQTVNNIIFGNTKLGAINGNVFNDTNANKLRDTGEAGLSSWRVFDDANNNGKLDSGEANTLTDANGNYMLTVGAGWHYIRVQSKPGYKLTTASVLKILLGDATRSYDKNFGFRTA